MVEGATCAGPARRRQFASWSWVQRSDRPNQDCGRAGTAHSRLMAKAIRCEGLLRRGEAEDNAALAHSGDVTQARISQIMNLIQLAPDTQEALLSLVPGPRAPVLACRLTATHDGARLDAATLVRGLRRAEVTLQDGGS